MGELTTAAGTVAIAAAALALLALAFCIVLSRRLWAVRQVQRVVLGDSGERDLVAHGSDLEQRLADLGARVAESTASLSERDSELAAALGWAISHCAVVRYDAMGEMTGRQSSSVALLDSHHSGVVLSSILHREQARLYAKEIVEGRSEFELSPEEEEAVSSALRPHKTADGDGRR